MTGSRIFIFGDAISIFARRHLLPSGYLPARISRNKVRFSSMERFLYGLSFPASVSVPRCALISSGERSQTNALPSKINCSA